jgi:ArsR family transcriptional regulator
VLPGDGVEDIAHVRLLVEVASRIPRISIAVNIDPCQYLVMQQIATIAASCPPLLQGALGRGEAERLAAALRVLADPSRLRLLSLIQAQADAEACVCHLTEPLGLSQPTVSHHLKVLRDAGLVEREQRGSWAYFRVVPGALDGLRDLLA